MHKTLGRQLRHLKIPTDGRTPPTAPQWGSLLERVSNAYSDGDQARYMLERSLELSSAEMLELHVKLQSERDNLQSIFESAALGILRLCEDGHILDANPAALEMFGLSRDELVGRSLQYLFDDEARSIRDGYIGCRRTSAYERRYIRKGGSIAWFHSTETWVEASPGARKFCTVVIDDVTEIKQLEGSLRHAQKLESVGRLAAGIAHEINTPIQFINDNVSFLSSAFVAIADLIAKLPRSEEAEEAADWEYLREEVPVSLAQTLEGLKRVATIVQSMKSFAHNDRGEQNLTDLNKLLQDTLTVASYELKGVAVAHCDLEESLPLVMCSRGDLGQVFLNLMINAAHAIADTNATKASGTMGNVYVTTRRDGEDVVVSIRDTGGGIPDHIRPNIFVPFFTTKEVGRGSGQGLALARSIVAQRHKGSLSFDTEVGVGTTFHVRLPIAGVRAGQPATDAAA